MIEKEGSLPTQFDEESDPRPAQAVYQPGGTLAPDDQLYIVRPADRELLALCRSGQFTYILAPRQIGKSSLMLKTAHQLGREAVRVVKLDLTRVGTQLEAEKWYYGLLYEIRKQLGLACNLRQWWQERVSLGQIQRLTLFFEEVVLTEVAEPVVIFVDEIDTTLSLDFADDFYAAVRSLYLERADRPALARLCFVLIGVATPGELIRDARRTPFNIGQRVEMTDFTLKEALPLLKGLSLPPPQARQMLEWVLDWTGGHPYLTQRLCQLVADATNEAEPNWTRTRLDRLVQSAFLGERSEQDNNLQFVRDMLTRRAPNRVGVLQTYRAIWQGKHPVADEEHSLVKSHLKLSGIVRRERGTLRLRNAIYRRAFDEGWIKEHLPVNWAKRAKQAGWLIALSLTVTILMSGLALYAVGQQSTANERAAEAQSARTTAEAALGQSDRQRQAAETEALALRSQSVTDPELRLLLAREAAARLQTGRLTDLNNQTESTLRHALQTYTPNRVLTGHTNAVYAASFSPDGKRIATASLDGTARIWDSATGQTELKITPDDAQQLFGATFSPDGQSLMTTGGTAILKYWDATSGRLKWAITGGCHGCEYRVPRFSPDGRLIVAAGNDGAAHLLDAATGQELVELGRYNDLMYSATFDPSGRLILTANGDGTARLYDSATYQEVQELKGHSGPVWEALFSPDGQLIVTVGKDGTARLWNTATGQKLQTLTGHTEPLNQAAFSPDAKTVATAGDDGTARLWEAGSGKLIAILRGHTGPVWDVIFSPTGREVVTAGQDGTLRVWDAGSGQPLTTFYGHSGGVAGGVLHAGLSFSPDGRWLLSASVDGTARLWDWQNLDQYAVCRLAGHSDTIANVAFSPDGKYLASASNDNTVRVWDIANRREVVRLEKDYYNVTNAVFSPDGLRLLTSSNDRNTYIWDTRQGWSGESVESLGAPFGDTAATTATYSPSGKYIVTGRRFPEKQQLGGATWVWQRADLQKPPLTLPGIVGNGLSSPQIFSPDEGRILTARDNLVEVWSVTTGQEVMKLSGHSLAINSAAFSPDGRLIASAGQDGTVRLWQALDGQSVRVLRGHNGVVNSVNFSPDSRLLVTSGQDGTARVWEVSTGQIITVLDNHSAALFAATFSPDGKLIALGGTDKVVQVYSCSFCGTLPHLLTEAQTLLPRSLTEAERRQFGLLP